MNLITFILSSSSHFCGVIEIVLGTVPRKLRCEIDERWMDDGWMMDGWLGK